MRGSFKLSIGGGGVLPPGAVMPRVTLRTHAITHARDYACMRMPMRVKAPCDDGRTRCRIMHVVVINAHDRTHVHEHTITHDNLALTTYQNVTPLRVGRLCNLYTIPYQAD